MEIVAERTVEQEGGWPTLVVVDVTWDPAAHGTDSADGHTIVSQLVSVLAFLKPFYTPQDNVQLDINLCPTTADYPSWWYERLVFLARQQVRFPVPVYITQNTGSAQECYAESNRALSRYRARFGRDGGGSGSGGSGGGSGGGRNDPGGEDEDKDEDDGYDYEKILKSAIVEFTRRHCIEEPALERLLQIHHSLEELLGAAL